MEAAIWIARRPGAAWAHREDVSHDPQPEDLGSKHGQVTHILLSKGIAAHACTMHTRRFAAGFLALLLRLMK